MKNKYILPAIALAAAFFVFNACKEDHDHDENDVTAPILTVEEPVGGAVISGEVHIRGTVTDESLHEMEIKVTVDATGTELFKVTPTVHDLTEYHFDEHFTPNVAAETAVTLTITVEDHNHVSSGIELSFIVKP